MWPAPECGIWSESGGAGPASPTQYGGEGKL